MNQFNRLNKILGWLVFFIALATYTLTMEKTGSLWDCGEFLSCTHKLQVAHPPGAPFFMIVGKIFSLFSFGDPSKVAMSINFLSALSTAFCTLFFFWSSVMFLKMVFIKKDEEIEENKMYLILFGSFIAAVAATFLDSMWFNAIEGEVYAFSVFFMAFNVWAILKWNEDDSPKADYWLLLIAVFTGMSIGVHLLSLLVFPLITLIFYYKRFKPTVIGALISFVISVVLIQVVMKVVLSMTSAFLGKMDLLFVNSFGLPFYSGSIAGVILIIVSFIYLIKRSNLEPKILVLTKYKWLLFILPFIYSGYNVINYSSVEFPLIKILLSLIIVLFLLYLLYIKDKNFHLWDENVFKISSNTLILFFAFLFMGYTSYFMVVIRANANLPINMNVPDNFLILKSYIDREQYGDRPLLFGPHYYDVGEVEAVEDKSDIYIKNPTTKKYELVGTNKQYKYPAHVKKFFPRVGHEGEDKKSFYRAWMDPKYDIIDRATNKSVQTFERGQAEQAEQTAAQMNGQSGQQQYVVKDKVSSFDNLAYMVKYQIGFMYFRYLMWNTAGRIDDHQGRATNDYGRWTSGINFIDNLTGDIWGNAQLDQSGRPKEANTSKAHNKFYMIPFLLCILGIFYSYKTDRKSFSLILLLVFATGIMQVIFHNEPPVEPRERDYVYAPSYWAFLFWLPFGIMFIYNLLKDKLSAKLSMVVSLLIGLAAPVLMGSQGWDDHNRGNRSTTLAFAKNMLEACPPNAILFCYGDNDTYPLWYAQEIENIRPDVRVINTSLIEGDAYISQLRLPMNESKAVKLTIPQDRIKGDKRSYFRLNQNGTSGDTMPLKDVIDFMMSDDPAAKVSYNPNYPAENYLPTTNVYFDLDPAKAIQTGFLVPKGKEASVPTRVYLQLPSNMSRGSILQLDVLVNNLYERPICFASSNPSVAGLGLKNYLLSQGMLVMFSPVGGTDLNGMETMDAERMYNQVFKYDFGKVKENDILLDEHTLISFNGGMKPAIANLAMYYAVNNQPERVEKLLNHLYTNIPASKLPYNYVDLPALQAATISKNQKYTKEISEGMYKYCTANLDWITSPNNAKKAKLAQEELRLYLGSLNGMQEILTRSGDSVMVKKIQEKMNQYNMVLN